MLTIYVVDYDRSQPPVIGQAIRTRFAAGRLPACSLVGVRALVDAGFLIAVGGGCGRGGGPSGPSKTDWSPRSRTVGGCE
jgi:hypothetical protein